MRARGSRAHYETDSLVGACFGIKPRMSHKAQDLQNLIDRVEQGGAAKYHEKNAQEGKLFARDRIRLLLDDNARDFVEDGLLANNAEKDLPADGVVTGVGTLGGR